MRYLRILHYIDTVARVGSIRKAAEDLALTASALNRRIQDFETEFGTPIFERMPRGVRLNAAGELLVRQARAQIAEMERVRSQVADLSGIRRGHVRIACSQAVAYTFLPEMVADYKARFPDVSFDVLVRDHLGAQQALLDYSADLALIIEPTFQSAMQPICIVEQPLYAVMGQDHPLASKTGLRLREMLRYPLALPERSFGGRLMLEQALARRALSANIVLESNSFEFLRAFVRREPAITVQLAIGAPDDPVTHVEARGLSAIMVDPRDIPPGRLILAQMRERTLPVASAKFADMLARRLELAARQEQLQDQPG